MADGALPMGVVSGPRTAILAARCFAVRMSGRCKDGPSASASARDNCERQGQKSLHNHGFAAVTLSRKFA